jgi:hypothetical protein
MLTLARDTVGSFGTRHAGTVFVQADWQDLPSVDESLATVVGDNSFSYLPYPHGWKNLATRLARCMQPGAKLLMRICSVPPSHCRTSVGEVVERYLAGDMLNCTEVRAALLFAHWNRSTYEIDTEEVLRTFETQRSEFAPLFDRFRPPADNDLETIRKYRGVRARYYAPPIEQGLTPLQPHFEVTSVEYGPYPMADYFPLVVARRR